MAKFIDLTGQRFGRLKVIKRAENKGKETRWLCKCDCGNETITSGARLKNGQTKSCGCIRTENIVGKKFGRILVLEKTNKKDKWNKPLYHCVCDCGKELYYPYERLTHGNIETKSCGCYIKDYLREKNRKQNRIEIEGDIAKIYFFNSDRYAIIDSEDVDKVKDYCWRDGYNKYYPNACINGKHIDLHRLIKPNNDKRFVTDHINRKPLDNRKCNLRIVTQMVNCGNRNLSKLNKTGYSNICYVEKRKKYRVLISRNYKKFFLGEFKDIQTAKRKLEEFLEKNKSKELSQWEK